MGCLGNYKLSNLGNAVANIVRIIRLPGKLGKKEKMVNLTSTEPSQALQTEALGIVLGCGLSRTGNKSLGNALKILGYNPIKYPKAIDDLGTTYNAAVDITVIAWFDELDAKFPDAKWILTIREMESWLNSCEKWFSRPLEQYSAYKQDYLRHYRHLVYGADSFDRELWSTVYQQHVERVKHKFQDRPHQLLIMNICEGESWEKLCSFVGKAIPSEAFPSIS